MLGVTFVSAGGLLVFTNIKPDVRFEIDLRLTWNWNAATQMFCENIFFRSLVQSYSYIIMKLYPLYIVHISPPHSRPLQHQHRKPAPLLCHCAFLYLGVLPDQNLCQEPTPQVSPSLTKVGFNIILSFKRSENISWNFFRAFAVRTVLLIFEESPVVVKVSRWRQRRKNTSRVVPIVWSSMWSSIIWSSIIWS